MKEHRFVIGKGGNTAEAVHLLQTAAEQFDTEVVIRRHRLKRSDEQNAALWAVAYKTLRDATGNDPEDLHRYFCGEYFGWVEYEVMGARRKRPRRTTTTNEDGHRDLITTLDFADFYNFVQQRSAETVGVFIPDPDPNWRQNIAAQRAAQS